ncbi:uncharacterized protein LOC133192902 [Saccostrea echinata]|uniref:uncharacterized protein LOC133192902 n=1 Tax=Saccostrea echinata TaxID=191078 RepID=UPI002A81499D|nr:uncharacterized protein LOC133192902 [Saccostrea echinata]
MCALVGTPQEVTIRRDVSDIIDIVRHQASNSLDYTMMSSGSFREGFRMKSSDYDSMHWPNNQRVVWDLCQVQYYDIQRNTLILADTSESPPGYALLWLPIPNRAAKSLSSVVFRMNNRVYISSSAYKETFFSPMWPGSNVHGPCHSGFYGGLIEYDEAYCLACDFWPPSASSWIARCHSWPKSHVVRDIVSHGCHFVAIGHKLGNHEDEEWRISFSLAEQKLVYSMNHCQFLTYGILKLFMNDVLNSNHNPKLYKSIEEPTLLSETELDIQLFKEIYTNRVSTAESTLKSCIKFLNAVEFLIGTPLTQYQLVKIEKHTACILQSTSFVLYNTFTAFILHNVQGKEDINKFKYIIDKIAHRMLRLAAKFGFISDTLFLAMYYYKTYRYKEALAVLQIINVKTAQPFLMHLQSVNEEKYREAMGGLSWSTKAREAVMSNVCLFNDLCYFNELIIEQQSSLQSPWYFLFIPPLVLLRMLEFLCYSHIDIKKAQTAVYDLQVLVHHDQEVFLKGLKDISWQILGICQHMTGNLQAALYSYQQSLRQVRGAPGTPGDDIFVRTSEEALPLLFC